MRVYFSRKDREKIAKRHDEKNEYHSENPLYNTQSNFCVKFCLQSKNPRINNAHFRIEKVDWGLNKMLLSLQSNVFGRDSIVNGCGS